MVQSLKVFGACALGAVALGAGTVAAVKEASAKKAKKTNYKNKGDKKVEDNAKGEIRDASEEKRPPKSKEGHKKREMAAADKKDAPVVPAAKKYTGDLVELSKGSKMPVTGLGMCCRPSAHGDKAKESVVDYIKLGGRHIDTGRIYENHKNIGEALAQFKDIRSELFITTKLPSHDTGYENTLKAVKESLVELQVEYVDSVLIHGPGPTDKKHEQPSCVKYSTDEKSIKAYNKNVKDMETIKAFERALREATTQPQEEPMETKTVWVDAMGGFGAASDDDDDDDDGEAPELKLTFQNGAVFVPKGSEVEGTFKKLLKILKLKEANYAYGPGSSVTFKAEPTGDDLPNTAMSYYLDMTTDAGKKAFEALTDGIAEIKQAEFSDEFVYNCENKIKDYRGCWSETWKALEELKDQGLVKNIGVSNFGVTHLQYFKQMATDNGFKHVQPQINQIEFGARGYYDSFEPTKETLEYCKEEGIHVVGYGTLAGFGGKDKVLKNDALQKLATSVKPGLTVSQLMSRWSLQHGVSVIPGTGDAGHMSENLDVFNFKLSEEHMREIEKICGTNYFYYMFGL